MKTSVGIKWGLGRVVAGQTGITRRHRDCQDSKRAHVLYPFPILVLLHLSSHAPPLACLSSCPLSLIPSNFHVSISVYSISPAVLASSLFSFPRSHVPVLEQIFLSSWPRVLYLSTPLCICLCFRGIFFLSIVLAFSFSCSLPRVLVHLSLFSCSCSLFSCHSLVSLSSCHCPRVLVGASLSSCPCPFPLATSFFFSCSCSLSFLSPPNTLTLVLVVSSSCPSLPVVVLEILFLGAWCLVLPLLSSSACPLEFSVHPSRSAIVFSSLSSWLWSLVIVLLTLSSWPCFHFLRDVIVSSWP